MNDQFMYESIRNANSDDNSPNDEMDKLEQHIPLWLEYCRATESIVRDYLQRCGVRIRRFPNAQNGHLFMLEVLQEDPQIAFQEFRMYHPLFVNFTHILRDEFGLSSRPNMDIYEQVGMFLCILAHGKGYRQMRNMFGHSMDTIHHYFGVVLCAVVGRGARIIRPKPNYNEIPPGHRPCRNKHPHFQVSAVYTM
ncbi:DDE Tnp4 domain-containing protein [Abeliophyllum distichum]|uniref:DDE Tnp4 domain-containing protein n=1 Tax=Abeliophyllum distichum TaxID=126358 RepID=A0ABD1QFL4_9LAMI